MASGYPDLGALVEAEGVRFRVWAPSAKGIEVVVEGQPIAHAQRGEAGYFEALLPGLSDGARYRLRLDGDRLLPDPASRFQPDGVHGSSQIVAPGAYRWGDGDWRPPPKESLVFYELHLGTFSPEGTFEGARQRLRHLAELGVNAIELMPVAEFPGRWNWGYDGGALWAPCRAYGRPEDLRRLVDEAHRLGLAMILDVVYNHFGPDGAYAVSLGPFLTDKHKTLWGQAINLDDRGAAGVRAFFIANALHWLKEYHLDGLRLDATFALKDDSPRHFLTELAEAVHALPGPRRWVIAEDHRNLDQLVRPDHPRAYDLDAVWADDFHHLNRRIVAGDQHAYYRDYPDSTEALARTIGQGWLFTGQWSEHEKCHRGTDPTGIPSDRFIFCIQNHDQIGNRPFGERLNHQSDPAVFRACSALLLFVPELPLLFMGQEWAASSPFLYFTDHNPELGRLIREGRRNELGHFPGVDGDDVPDPQAASTFEASKLRWDERDEPEHAGALQLYRDLLVIRRQLDGAVAAESPIEGALSLRRGKHLLAVALRPGLDLPLTPGSQVIWHSEAPPYATSPHPPDVRVDRIHFPKPAAALIRLQ
jgi:maltooligosyltrehalose trehalohydrolase